MATVTRVLPWRRHSVRVESELTAIVAAYRRTRPGSSIDRIQRAYRLAAVSHGDQRRKSGESYISHPLAVAKVVAEFGLDDVGHRGRLAAAGRERVQDSFSLTIEVERHQRLYDHVLSR